MPKITGNDILKIALANPDVTVPPEAMDAIKPGKRNKYNAQACEFEAPRNELVRLGTRWRRLTAKV